jgi:superfamily II DNA helicase RecQ
VVSLSCDTFAVAQGGVTWCISPLLALAADQETKINAGSNTTITAIHIDAYRSPVAQKLLRDCITSLSLSSPTTTIILSSPQAIMHNSNYWSILHTLIRKRLLVLLAIDEIHLFVQFGLYFRSKFLQLRTLLFNRVRLANHRTRLPVLFMTATATAPFIRHLQLITGLWPSPIGMQCCSVCIKVRLNASVLNFVHKSIHPLCPLSTTASKQCLAVVW